MTIPANPQQLGRENTLRTWESNGSNSPVVIERLYNQFASILASVGNSSERLLASSRVLSKLSYLIYKDQSYGAPGS
jgi:hypothetical protein